MPRFLTNLTAVTFVAALAAPVVADGKTATATKRDGFASDGGLGGTRVTKPATGD